MTAAQNEIPDLERDSDLDALLADAGPPAALDLDEMFEGVDQGIERSDGSLRGWLQSRSTAVRRCLSLASLAVIVVVAVVITPRSDMASLGPAFFGSLAALAVLVGLCLWVALRPVHQPALSTTKIVALAGVSLGATVLFALVPMARSQPDVLGHGAHVLAGASPCMYMGLLLGLPGYVIARLLARGTPLASVLAAAAAGLAGNFFLQAHCPMQEPMHNLVGHASVAVLFVGGALLIRSFERRMATS
jgi:hypothetical protein